MTTIGVVSLGCPKNLTESETLLGILASAGYVVTPSLQEAEIILINTCGFIRAAVRESLEAIFNCARYQKNRRLPVPGRHRLSAPAVWAQA